MYWLSRRTRNDLFLLYCFAESELGTDQLRAIIARRSSTVPDLCVRLRPTPRDLSYPTWEPCAFDPGQFVEHRLPQADWHHLEQALGEVLATGVDAADRPWRLHVFRGITGAPLPPSAEAARREAAPAGPMRAAANGTNGPPESPTQPRLPGRATSMWPVVRPVPAPQRRLDSMRPGGPQAPSPTYPNPRPRSGSPSPCCRCRTRSPMEDTQPTWRALCSPQPQNAPRRRQRHRPLRGHS